MTAAARYLVFDVGGTQLRAAAYDGEREALGEVARADAPSFERHPGAGWHELRDKLVEDLTALRARVDPERRIASAVVAFPGPVDGEQRVLAAPPLWGAQGVYPYRLDRDLRDAWPGTAVCVTNDMTAAAYRYMRGGDDELCVVTISTGIGSKVLLRGRPLLGRTGQGGEIGHVQVDPAPDASACDCGGRGHLAAIASGRGLLARARRRADRDAAGFRASSLGGRMGRSAGALTAEDVAEGYRSGDAWAGSLVHEAAEALGLVFATIRLATGVDRYILIGGVSFGLGERFCEDVRSSLLARCWRGGADGDVAVVLGEDDGRCALIGAGRAIHLGLLP